MRSLLPWSQMLNALGEADLTPVRGRVVAANGLVVESAGPSAKLGEICTLMGDGATISAEVVGFRDQRVLLMPFEDPDGLRPGLTVEATGHPLRVLVGRELLGRVLDGLGRPMDGIGDIQADQLRPVMAPPVPALERPPIHHPLSLGVRVIDGFLTVGVGQRIGIFAGSGVGKSSLLGMIARSAQADCNVIALIGERGREVREFLERDLGPEGLKRSVVVVATSEQPALVRIRAAFTATAIAEALRDEGRDVLLMMDSVTRLAQGQREVGLATGEPPTTRGYTPSCFTLLPKLMERAGRTERGSITGIYTVLVDGDDMNEPVADAVRGILDGHVILSRKLAQGGQYPAVDVLASVSRVMNAVTTERHQRFARRVRALMAAYKNAEDLINIGAYQKGANPDVDEALRKLPAIRAFLSQELEQPSDLQAAIEGLRQLCEEDGL